MISRRTFFGHLVSLFGAASIPDLRKRIEDAARPILLAPPAPRRTLHVYEGGSLTLGPETLAPVRRPTWRETLRVEGVDVDDPATLARVMRARWLAPEDLDAPVSDVCWPGVYGSVWSPAARAARYLQALDIGPAFAARRGCLGRLAFHAGDNHPGSSDIWVDVADDVSASLLQARLIELGEPTRLVMETQTIVRD